MPNLQVGAMTLSLEQATDLLTTHLKAIVGVEFFTIPVYLTAVYSFTDEALAYQETSDGKTSNPLFTMQQNALSVAVQEMLHLQLACNLVSSLGDTPDIPQLDLQAGQTITIPHLKNAQGQPQTMKLGNLPEALDAFLAIESPDPAHQFPPPNAQAEYASISDLYHATLELLGLVAQAANDTSTPTFTDRNQVAYGTFPPTYPDMPMKVTNPASAVTAASAIADQGEGQPLTPVANARVSRALALFGFGNKAATGDEPNVAPQFRPEESSRFGPFGMYAHFTRFQQIRQQLGSADFQRWDAAVRAAYRKKDPSLDLGSFYPGSGKPVTIELPTQYPLTANDVTNCNNLTWSWITSQLSSGFGDGRLSPTYSTDPDAPSFTETMIAFKYVIALIWKFAQVPSFVPQQGVTGAAVQQAMDVADPLCLFHWDSKTRSLKKRLHPPFMENACHGLNSCSGMGWGGFADGPGNGACATADPHTCGGNNDCSGAGGCGFLVSPTGEACKSGKQMQRVAMNALRGDAGPGPLCGSKTSELLPPCAEWIPGMNSCAHLGGCQTPIGTLQVFSSGAREQIEQQGPRGGWTPKAKQALLDLCGKPVWDHARALLAEAMGGKVADPHAPVKEGPILYDGKLRRSMIQPTSPT